MTDDSIEAKALALVNEVSDKHTDAESIYEVHRSVDLRAALCRALEQHEAFKQEVSDAAERAVEVMELWSGDQDDVDFLKSFIIPKPKPDPLAEILGELNWVTAEIPFRAALEARGLEIREKGE